MLRASAILCSLFAVAQFASAADAPRKPLNLLLITADDMNADSVGWMGNKFGASPHVDAFAATAHKFVNHNVSAPICQPSRSALMTGRVPHRNGALGFHPINPGTATLVAVLKSQGYFTGVIDKHAHMKPDAEFPWDEKLSGSGKNPPLFREHVQTLLKAADDAKKPFFINANITDPHRPFPGSAQEAGRQGDNPKAVGRKKSKKSAAAPALTTRVYQPPEITVPSFLEDLPEIRTEIAQYYTAIARLDASFEGALGALKQSGHDSDTIVVFLSDHGISAPFSKATVYRNGTRSPVLLRWPGMGTPQSREEFVSSVDLMPTLLELLGAPLPPEMDGRSWLPLLNGQSQPDRDFVVTHVNTVSSGKSFPQRCIRTKDYSLMFHAWPTGLPIFRVEAMNGLTFNALSTAAKNDSRIAKRVDQLLVGAPLMFFDVRNDPDERVNLVADRKHRSEVERLGRLLVSHMERTGDPQLENFRTAWSTWKAGNGQ